MRATKAKEQSDREREKAELANRAKSVFLASMSHELRTSLNAILGFSRLMRNAAEVSGEQTRYLDIVLRSGEHLLNLINSDVQSLMYARATESGLTFAVVTPPDIQRYITADAVKLRQVIINLVGNAIKFTRSGAVALRASVEAPESSQQAWLRFEVEDAGSGIREADRDRLFHPFVQTIHERY
jgi:signal transduction histidine kinase